MARAMPMSIRCLSPQVDQTPFSLPSWGGADLPSWPCSLPITHSLFYPLPLGPTGKWVIYRAVGQLLEVLSCCAQIIPIPYFHTWGPRWSLSSARTCGCTKSEWFVWRWLTCNGYPVATVLLCHYIPDLCPYSWPCGMRGLWSRETVSLPSSRRGFLITNQETFKCSLMGMPWESVFGILNFETWKAL